MKDKHLTYLFFALFITCFVGQAYAEIYKFKDANGRWQFTDKPPKTGTASNTIISSTASTTSSADLKKKLFERYKPSSKVAEASLSVVTVETSVGSGSGFFITDSGYLITNRHVVRPSSTNNWSDKKVELQEWKERIEDMKLDLDENKQILTDRKSNIDENKDFIQSNKSSANDKKSFERYVARYERDKENNYKYEKKYKAEKSRYKSAQSEFDWDSSVSNFSKKFTIKLKNGDKLKVRLIKVSKDHDLALLKLDNHTTPFLTLSTKQAPRQGTKVFAIGSPLGIADSLSTGIITTSDKKLIYTDTKILPGNSGGPLVDNDGIVLGVNTAVLSQEKYAEGIGLVIYARFIRSEFKSSLPANFN